MNWRLIVVIIAIVAFILFGGINLTKSGFQLAKTETSKLKTDISSFISKNSIKPSTSPTDQQGKMT